MDILWITLVIIAFALAIFVLFLGKKKKTPTDYYNIFITGIMWFVIGLLLKSYELAAVGLLITIIGLNYRNKWKKQIKLWKELNKEEKIKRIIELSLLAMLIIVGILFMIMGQ